MSAMVDPTYLARRVAAAVHAREEGAVPIAWLVIGILIGAALVVFGIIKFLIPGE